MYSPILILFTVILSILYGAKSIDAETVWNALFHFDSSDVNHNIIITSRLPRVVAALLVGAFLAISGALMQGMTRNYLASPSIMGCDGWGSLCYYTLYDISSGNIINWYGCMFNDWFCIRSRYRIWLWFAPSKWLITSEVSNYWNSYWNIFK